MDHLQKALEDRRRAVSRVNAELAAIVQSPNNSVKNFRLGLLTSLCAELNTINERIRRGVLFRGQ